MTVLEQITSLLYEEARDEYDPSVPRRKSYEQGGFRPITRHTSRLSHPRVDMIDGYQGGLKRRGGVRILRDLRQGFRAAIGVFRKSFHKAEEPGCAYCINRSACLIHHVANILFHFRVYYHDVIAFGISLLMSI